MSENEIFIYGCHADPISLDRSNITYEYLEYQENTNYLIDKLYENQFDCVVVSFKDKTWFPLELWVQSLLIIIPACLNANKALYFILSDRDTDNICTKFGQYIVSSSLMGIETFKTWPLFIEFIKTRSAEKPFNALLTQAQQCLIDFLDNQRKPQKLKLSILENPNDLKNDKRNEND